MARQGNIQLIAVITAEGNLVAEGDRLFRSHGPWMERTHHRSGDKALLSYDVSKAPELTEPLDPTSDPTGRIHFILSEVYETESGVADHFEQAEESWEDYPAFMEWLDQCEVTTIPIAPIFNSLW